MAAKRSGEKMMEYLVRTYTNEGETVLDSTTDMACNNAGRNFIGIERDPEYFKIAQRRIYGID